MIENKSWSCILLRYTHTSLEKLILYKVKRTISDDIDFQKLVVGLDQALAIRDGEEDFFFARINKTSTIKHMVVVCKNGNAVGCGAMKEYA